MEKYSLVIVFIIGFLSGFSIHNYSVFKHQTQPTQQMGFTPTIVRDGDNKINQEIIIDSNSIKIVPTLELVAESLIENISEINPVHSKVIGDYYMLAVQEQRKYRFPASVKLAQMILEGGYSLENPNGSKLVIEAKNPFGIKYFGEGVPERVQKWDELVYSNDYVLAKDDCKGKCRFVKFRGMWHAFRYHSEFMTGVDGFPSHYSKYITTGDWKDWVNAIRKGNYATYKYYHIELTNLIEKYRLYKLDQFS